MKKMLQDSNGNTSSKRVMGTIGMVAYLFSSILIVFYSVYSGGEISANAVSMLNGVGIVSGGLLGVGVFEGLKK